MKRILLIAVLLIASFNVLKAQDIHFGVAAGVNFTDLTDLSPTPSGFSTPTTNMITGFHVGGVVNCPIYDKFSIDASLLFYTCGGKINYSIPASSMTSGFYTISTTAYSYSTTVNLSYLKIPLMAKYKFDNGFSVFAGPYLGILLAAKRNVDAYSFTTTSTNNLAVPPTPSTSSITSDVPSRSINIDTASVMYFYDGGIAFGIGYQLPMGLGLSVKYSIGFTSVFQNDPSRFDPDWGNNRAFEISLSYMFGMKKAE